MRSECPNLFCFNQCLRGQLNLAVKEFSLYPYKVTRFSDHLIQIENEVGNCCTLVIGQDQAILFDTMCGLGDLKAQVEALTSLPLIVINSHAHYDHMGGNFQFDTVYMNTVDRFIMKQTLKILDIIESNLGKDLSKCRLSFSMEEEGRLKDIKPDMIFDLGGIQVTVIDLTGHTPGSIGLLLEGELMEEKVLLVGDATSPQMCLFWPDSLSLGVYQETLKKMMDMDFSWFLQAHFSKKFPKSVLLKFWECSLLPQKKRGIAYQNTHVPEYRGKMYLYKLRDPEIDEMICLIDKQ